MTNQVVIENYPIALDLVPSMSNKAWELINIVNLHLYNRPNPIVVIGSNNNSEIKCLARNHHTEIEFTLSKISF